jgi:hypothetical protein
MIDGVSIGGNDLLQLTLGVDRDSEKITYLSSDENLSYRRMISMAIKTYKKNGGKHVPICKKCNKQFKKENGWSCDDGTAIRGENLGESALKGLMGGSAYSFPAYCSLKCARNDGKCW